MKFLRIMMNRRGEMFKRVILEIRFEIKGTVRVEIWNENNELCYIKTIVGACVPKFGKGVSTLSVKAFNKSIEALGLPKWKDTYAPPYYSTLGREAWKVSYETSFHGPMVKRGENKYPENWKEFLGLIESVVGDFEYEKR